MKYFKKSLACMYKFVGVCNTYSIKVGRGLSIDVKTSWSSTYRMLQTCIEYRNAFHYYAESDTKYEWLPIQSEWDLFEKIQLILGTMSSATTAFSGSTYPTINLPHCQYFLSIHS